jgi:hypothetical protein
LAPSFLQEIWSDFCPFFIALILEQTDGEEPLFLEGQLKAETPAKAVSLIKAIKLTLLNDYVGLTN